MTVLKQSVTNVTMAVLLYASYALGTQSLGRASGEHDFGVVVQKHNVRDVGNSDYSPQLLSQQEPVSSQSQYNTQVVGTGSSSYNSQSTAPQLQYTTGSGYGQYTNIWCGTGPTIITKTFTDIISLVESSTNSLVLTEIFTETCLQTTSVTTTVTSIVVIPVSPTDIPSQPNGTNTSGTNTSGTNTSGTNTSESNTSGTNTSDSQTPNTDLKNVSIEKLEINSISVNKVNVGDKTTASDTQSASTS
ncbi:hypothetical protein AX774_g1982 [Zancudomyces culisetae]|uniref:Uncharacterized protein n=1 Tax=Zancudomyces culisetae TaxID=1213189 RepID=A0A1R1PUB2_ZANCU|nr:hypothetical protein AX774_g1982 [Zancudomyces culisetae]|eukprot:OMH84493.1 hypothetical protein AX774_g1982 [Zancudomyces culisetae]